MRHLINAFAEYERALIGARTRTALRVNKARGERVGAVPFGYRVSGGDPVRLEPEPGEQEVIRIVHELREQGLSLRAIDEDLRAQGHEPRGGCNWHVQTLSNIAKSRLTE
jgi:DNA invertase Pin-like site-specific DNA recombinase